MRWCGKWQAEAMWSTEGERGQPPPMVRGGGEQRGRGDGVDGEDSGSRKKKKRWYTGLKRTNCKNKTFGTI